VHSYQRLRRTMSISRCDKRAWQQRLKLVEHISETCTLPTWQSTITQRHLIQCGQDQVRVHLRHQTSITLDPIMVSARPSGLSSSVISPNQPRTRICVMLFGEVTWNISDTYQLSSVLYVFPTILIYILIAVRNIRRPSVCSCIPQHRPSSRRSRQRLQTKGRMGNKRL
jgi:hypothetical protein